MSFFELVTMSICFTAVAVALIATLRHGGPLDQLGRQGAMWFSHDGDLPLDQRVSEDERDAPLPHRALRGRPE